MRSAGIDVGSRTVKFVIIERGAVTLARKCLTTHNPVTAARSIMDGTEFDVLTGTGYGRHLIREHFECAVISEIKAFAIGTRAIRPSSRAILDIGGQDTKAISLDDKGDMSKFEMNDRCAAGTGRFLEIMARTLGYTLEEFSGAALSAGRAEKINSMCTVFAESEVISLTARGALRHEVALGIHKTIVGRSTALLQRISPSGEIFFAGGVALNDCVRKLIGSELGRPVFVPADPQIVGAIGAAIHAAKET